MTLLVAPGQTGRVEVDVETLDDDERFALMMYRGISPAARVEHQQEMHEQRAAMSDEDVSAKTHRGFEKLLARGVFGPQLDAEGRPMVDPADGQPLYTMTGKVITRMTLVKR